jgi:long-chain acyl-CoA synthetase
MADGAIRSVSELFHRRVDQTPNDDAMYGRTRPGKGWFTLSWTDTAARVRKVACGLLSLGIEKGDRVAILCATKPDWVIVDLGILDAGGATTTVYTSNTPEECEHILSDSASVLCFAENAEQAAKLLEVRDALPSLRRVIVMDGETAAGGDWFLSMADLEAQGEAWDTANPGAYDRSWQGVGPEDIATLIYTSGTTGKPKGVVLAHSNWVHEAEAIAEVALLVPGEKTYLFLPLAHSFAKVIEVAFIHLNSPTACDADLDELIDNVGEVGPATMPAVPRIFEKVYNKVVSGAREAGGLKLKIFEWSRGVGREVSKLRQHGQEPSGGLALKHKIADKLVFSKLKNRFGGKVRYFVSGGAPLSREIAEFFHAADLLVLEGYGLTESSAASFVNRPTQYKFGTVGMPLPRTEVKFAEDGEILIGGPGVMQGYHNLPDASAEALDAEGWLHTGDIGEMDDDGFLKITDRKKDIIVTAGGKNIAPQYIENLLKTGSRYISQVVMLGDRRPYCVELVTINEETVGKWAADQGIEAAGYAELAARPEVQGLIEGAVRDLNAKLASYETIKKIHVLPRDFSQETGELTPKMSIKRKVVERTWGDVLEGMYAGTHGESV